MAKTNKKEKKKKYKKINKKVVAYSLIGIASLVLTYFVDWLFIIVAAIMVFLNQREIMKSKKKK